MYFILKFDISGKNDIKTYKQKQKQQQNKLKMVTTSSVWMGGWVRGGALTFGSVYEYMYIYKSTRFITDLCAVWTRNEYHAFTHVLSCSVSGNKFRHRNRKPVFAKVL